MKLLSFRTLSNNKMPEPTIHRPRHRYYAFNKPYGVLSSFTDPERRPTLSSYIKVPGIYSAGRLDMDSEGLLLLTDDGWLIHRLTDPRFDHPKTYWVQVEGLAAPPAVERLRQGVVIQGYRTRPAEARLLPDPEIFARARPITPHGPTSWIELRLFEGKKRQIRHMTAAVGLPTLRLVRVAVGPITLGDLPPGESRPLSDHEIEGLVAG